MGVCGCTPNGEWKKHLREVLDQLNGMVETVFLEICQGKISDPWKVLGEYGDVLAGSTKFDHWFNTRVSISINPEEKLKFQQLFKAMADAQSMFTSCGWFFEDFDRIEPRNNVTTAAHCVWLIKQTTGVNLTDEICPSLDRVKSWRTGIEALRTFVLIISSLFTGVKQPLHLAFCVGIQFVDLGKIFV